MYLELQNGMILMKIFARTNRELKVKSEKLKIISRQILK
jgi:hypothetical protein